METILDVVPNEDDIFAVIVARQRRTRSMVTRQDVEAVRTLTIDRLEDRGVRTDWVPSSAALSDAIGDLYFAWGWARSTSTTAKAARVALVNAATAVS